MLEVLNIPNYFDAATKGLMGAQAASESLTASPSAGFQFRILGNFTPPTITIPLPALWLGFWIVAAVFATMSVILFYHWKNFEFDKLKIRFMTLLYTGVGLFLLLTIFNAIAVYALSL